MTVAYTPLQFLSEFLEPTAAPVYCDIRGVILEYAGLFVVQDAVNWILSVDGPSSLVAHQIIAHHITLDSDEVQRAVILAPRGSCDKSIKPLIASFEYDWTKPIELLHQCFMYYSRIEKSTQPRRDICLHAMLSSWLATVAPVTREPIEDMLERCAAISYWSTARAHHSYLVAAAIRRNLTMSHQLLMENIVADICPFAIDWFTHCTPHAIIRNTMDRVGTARAALAKQIIAGDSGKLLLIREAGVAIPTLLIVEACSLNSQPVERWSAEFTRCFLELGDDEQMEFHRQFMYFGELTLVDAWMYQPHNVGRHSATILHDAFAYLPVAIAFRCARRLVALCADPYALSPGGEIFIYPALQRDARRKGELMDLLVSCRTQYDGLTIEFLADSTSCAREAYKINNERIAVQYAKYMRAGR